MTEKQVFTKMVLDGWKGRIENVRELLKSLSDDDLKLELSPGKNSVGWVIAHLAAANLDVMKLLGFTRPTIHPGLEAHFANQENRQPLTASGTEIRDFWEKSQAALTQKIDEIPVDDWFTHHTMISDADFAKEPHRNKLNVILNRSLHTAHHLGQLTLHDPRLRDKATR